MGRSGARRTIAIAIVTGPLGACFEGSAASGLPCRDDLDCGLADRCIAGICGGASPTTGVDPTGSTGPDPSSGEPLCGGKPGATCEPQVPGLSDADCDSDCSAPHCGDGLFNVFAPNDAFNPPMGTEECDDGDPASGQPRDTARCDADCTSPVCGDGDWNPEAEACEDDDFDDFDGCTADCQVPVFATRFDDRTWTSEPYDLSHYSGTMWDPVGTSTDVTGWRWSGEDWDTGAIPYRGPPATFNYNYSGVTRLVSPPLDLPASVPEGFTLQLRFSHAFVGEGPCAQASAQADGGVVRLRRARAEETLTPVPGYSPLANECTGMIGGVPTPPNPMYEAAETPLAFTGAGQSGEVTVDLTAHLGAEGAQLVFEFGTDCAHCIMDDFDDSPRWAIDDVIVAAFPAG